MKRLLIELGALCLIGGIVLAEIVAVCALVGVALAVVCAVEAGR